MSEHAPPPAAPPPAPLVVPAGLGPAAAPALKAEALAALALARGSGQPLAVAMDEGRPAPCAVQMLVAITRSAARDGIAIELSPLAEAALAPLDDR